MGDSIGLFKFRVYKKFFNELTQIKCYPEHN